jgi:hypothetical protein
MRNIGAIERVSIRARKPREAEAFWTAFLRTTAGSRNRLSEAVILPRWRGARLALTARCATPRARSKWEGTRLSDNDQIDNMRG